MEIQDNQAAIPINELERIGINIQSLQIHYQMKTGKTLNLTDMIKVSTTDEGKNIKFETLDKISITVDAFSAAGNWNKVD